jgi:hypothetical protein
MDIDQQQSNLIKDLDMFSYLDNLWTSDRSTCDPQAKKGFVANLKNVAASVILNKSTEFAFQFPIRSPLTKSFHFLKKKFNLSRGIRFFHCDLPISHTLDTLFELEYLCSTPMSNIQ